MKKKGNCSDLLGDVCSGETFMTGSHNQVWDSEQGEFEVCLAAPKGIGFLEPKIKPGCQGKSLKE